LHFFFPNKYLQCFQNEFVKSLSSNLRSLRKIAEEKQTDAIDASGDEYTDDGDDDYVRRNTKRRRIGRTQYTMGTTSTTTT